MGFCLSRQRMCLLSAANEAVCLAQVVAVYGFKASEKLWTETQTSLFNIRIAERNIKGRKVITDSRSKPVEGCCSDCRKFSTMQQCLMLKNKDIIYNGSLYLSLTPKFYTKVLRQTLNSTADLWCKTLSRIMFGVKPRF